MNQWITDYAPGADELMLCDIDADGNGETDIREQYQNTLYCYYWQGSNCVLWQRCNGVPTNFYLDQGMFMYEFYCGRPSQAAAESPITSKIPAERCE